MEFNEEQVAQFLSAVKFSAHKHRNQRRKGAEGSPYINHPIQVADLLWHVGQVRDMETLVAAILHDTIEDTETTPQEIEERFGQRVLALVQECSDDKSLEKAERKRLQIVNAPHKSVAAKHIKLADKINNVQDIVSHPPAHWNLQRRLDYLDWATQVVNGLRDANEPLAHCFDESVREARQKLAPETA
ncbi:MAG: bifunctional (p)ppGpp synthetase/guanosine-3',5'-bis(diphosphate) 3'-pyrophosphohydrolase [Acidobacteria bacterium]|nr:bifunctional (p)ppGpp synthetase/guanosine-3',5'-bis(diphosphate) 3'-pyrophosphohydrolase [Acidobacteriota bacterium]